MKVRAGFVTNSSSSSFIVAFREEALDRIPDEYKNQVPELNFFQAFIHDALVNCVWNDDNDRTERLYSVEEYDNVMKERYDFCSYDHSGWLQDFYREHPEAKKTRDLIEEALKAGKLVYYYSVPYSQKVKMNIIRLFIDQDVFEVLEEEKEH